MSTILRYAGVCALIVGMAAGCNDDSPSSGGDADAAGEAGTGGTPDAVAGAPAGGAGASGGGTGGADAGGGDAGGSDAGGSDAGGGAAGEGGDAGGGGAAGSGSDPLASFIVTDVNDVKENPESYTWFDFRPNVKKLILAGAAETEHIAILWYTVVDGAVGLHYHAKTESVYVIDGTQTDGKGSYTDGTVYFNPPGSGHAISDSSGFFLLAYAAPPDFSQTALDMIEAYEPITIDTTDANLTTTLAFTEKATGVETYPVPLEDTGGLEAELIETTSSDAYLYEGNYVLVLKGSCDVDGVSLGQGKLVVAKALAPTPYQVSATSGSTCLALAVSF